MERLAACGVPGPSCGVPAVPADWQRRYGIAVSGTMAVTSIAFYLVVTRRWNWPLAADISSLTTATLIISAHHRGLFVLTVMVVWNGQTMLRNQQVASLPTWDKARTPRIRCSGTNVRFCCLHGIERHGKCRRAWPTT